MSHKHPWKLCMHMTAFIWLTANRADLFSVRIAVFPFWSWWADFLNKRNRLVLIIKQDVDYFFFLGKAIVFSYCPQRVKISMGFSFFKQIALQSFTTHFTSITCCISKWIWIFIEGKMGINWIVKPRCCIPEWECKFAQTLISCLYMYLAIG